MKYYPKLVKATVCLFFVLLSLPVFSQGVEKGSWSLVVIPDTQNYVKNAEYQGILELMNGWIAKNKDLYNVVAALHVGDIVDANNLQTVVRGTNQTGTQQWHAASTAFQRLDGVVPYIMALGNHDYGTTNGTARTTRFNEFFPKDRNPLMEKHLIEMGENASGEKTMENAAFVFPLPNGKTLLIVTLEFAPSDLAIRWAKSVFNQEQYRDALGVVLTHTYIYANGNRILKENYPMPDVNYGEALWKNLIYPSSNIRLVICGHIGNKEFVGSTAYSSDTNVAGKKVSQILFDTQFIGDNGGDGWLRILEFTADGDNVKAKTFSPLFDISPTTRHAAWEKSSFNEYEFTINLE